MFWIQIKTDIMSVLVSVQTVCIGYQQKTKKVTASKGGDFLKKEWDML